MSLLYFLAGVIFTSTCDSLVVLQASLRTDKLPILMFADVLVHSLTVLILEDELSVVQIAADNNRDEDSFNNFNKIAILKIKVQMKDL